MLYFNENFSKHIFQKFQFLNLFPFINIVKMTDNYQQTATISISYIFLKLKGSVDSRSKRIIFPRSFDNLLRTAKKIFDGVIEVNTLFDDKGEQINDLSNVVPGSTIYVSSLNPNDIDEIVVKKPPQSPMKPKKEVMAQNSFNRLFGNADPDDIQPPEEDDLKDLSLYDENVNENDQNDDQSKKKKFVSPSQKKLKAAQKEAAKKGKTIKPNDTASNADSTTSLSKKNKLQKKPISQAKTYQPRDFDNDADYDEDEYVSQTSQNKEQTPKKPKRKLSSKPSELPEPEQSPSPAKNTLKFPSPRSKSMTPKSPSKQSRNSNTDYMQEIINGSQDNTAYQSDGNDYVNPNDNFNYEDNVQHSSSMSSRNQQDRQSDASNRSGSVQVPRGFGIPQDRRSNTSNRSGSVRQPKGFGIPQDNQSKASNRSGSQAPKGFGIPQDNQSNASNRSGSLRQPKSFGFPRDNQSNFSNRSGSQAPRGFGIPRDNQSNASNRSGSQAPRGFGIPQDNQSNVSNRSGSHVQRGFGIPQDNQSNVSNRSGNSIQTPKSIQKRSQIPRPLNKSPSTNPQTPTPQTQKEAQPAERQKAMTLVVNANKPANSGQSSNAPSVVSLSGAASDRNSQVPEDDMNEGVEEGNENLQQMIDETVEPGALANVLDESLELLPDCADSLRKLPELERQQKIYWYKQGLRIAESQNLPPIPENASGVQEMVDKARSIITQHRFPNNSGVTYRLNFGIIGPQGSGKSVFLRVFLEELLTDLAINDEWKDTFIFILDLCNIITYATNHLQFYKAIVAVTMQSIMWECPSLIPHITMIHKMFDDVTEYALPPKFGTAFSLDPETQRIAAELQIIINKLSIIWNDEECLTEWINSIVYLPMLVSKALGFKKCIYVLDHYDFADTYFSPTNAKFVDSPSQINLIDVYNFALVHCNFVLSCSNQHDFLNLIEQVPEEEQLKPQFELISTIGLIQEDTYEDKQITIGFNDDTFPTTITCAICGGIPMLQHQWNEINKCLDILESDQEEEEDKIEELRDDLNLQVQNAMKYFFTDEDGRQRIHEVVSVRRRTIQDKSKKSETKSVHDNSTYNEDDDPNYNENEKI